MEPGGARWRWVHGLVITVKIDMKMGYGQLFCLNSFIAKYTNKVRQVLRNQAACINNNVNIYLLQFQVIAVIK